MNVKVNVHVCVVPVVDDVVVMAWDKSTLNKPILSVTSKPDTPPEVAYVSPSTDVTALPFSSLIVKSISGVLAVVEYV